MVKKVNFVAINLFSSAILFARSILFLKYLPEKDLGLIMLFNAIISILGLLQIGLFNGGLRIFSINEEVAHYQNVNNTNVTYVLLVISVLMLGSIVLNFFVKFDLLIFFVAFITGGFALLKNWFSNVLVARGKLHEVNILNLLSSIIAALLTVLIFWYQIVGALISIASINIVFVIFFVIWQKEYRPTKFLINKVEIRKILAYGFIPYLSGIAVLINNQIDRFFIAGFLSMEELGKFFLASTFITLFNLFPNNINYLLLPSAINDYSNRNTKKTFKTSKVYFLIIMGYSIIIVLLLYIFGVKVISIFFPNRIEQLNILFIMLPGIIALSFSRPINLILYVALNLKAILWSNIFSLISYLGILCLLLIFGQFSIINIAYGKTLQGFLVLVFLGISFILSKKNIINFKYIDKQNS